MRVQPSFIAPARASTSTTAQENLQSNTDLAHLLASAIADGHEGTVAELLSRSDADVHRPFASGTTLLLIAIEHGQLAIAQRLVAHGANIHAPRKDGATPLHVACEQGHGEIAQWLLQRLRENVPPPEAAALLNQRTASGATPLHLAAASGNGALVQFLLGRDGIDINAADDSGWTALHSVAHTRHTHIAALLLRKIDVDTPSAQGATPFLLAVHNGQFAMAEFLLSNGAAIHHPMDDGVTPLHLACTHEDAQAARWLLEQPEILELNGQACDLPTVLNHPDADGRTPLHLAALAGNAALVDLLLGQAGIDPNHADAKGWAPLHGAARAGHADTVVLLLRHALTDIFQAGPHGRTFLHAAVTGQNALQVAQAVQKLLHPDDFLALCDTPDAWGTRPASLAAQRGQDKAVVQALPLTPVTTTLPLKPTGYKRGWLITGSGFPKWKDHELLDIALQAKMQLKAHGNGQVNVSWRELQEQDIRAGDFVIVQCHGYWNDDLQCVMLELGEKEQVPLVDVAFWLLKKGVTKAVFTTCEGARAGAPLLRRLQNDPGMAQPEDPKVGYRDLDYTIVGPQGVTSISLNRDAVILTLKDCAALLNKTGAGDGMRTRSVQPTSTLHWDAILGQLALTQRAALEVHQLDGLPPEEATKAKASLLLLQAMENNLAAVQDLLTTHHVDPNAHDEIGWTALHLACYLGHANPASLHTSLVQLLLEAGADPKLKTLDGLSALDIAQAHGHHAIVELLR